jgi:ribosomal protein S18 acetylase RimI-like enzyme
LARLKSVLVWLEALPRASGQENVGSFSGIVTEKAVAAAVAVLDPRRDDSTAYLAWLHCINDLASLERLLDAISEQLRHHGVRKIIGPTGLSPHLGSGLLQDQWNVIPPLHTPYNPPYLPEIAAATLRVRSSGRLFYLPTSPAPARSPTSPATLDTFEPHRLGADLLVLLASACPPWLDFVPPDIPEAEFLLQCLALWPLRGWLAKIDGEAVGFVLLQPDLALKLRRAGGGRNPFWWIWLRWTRQRPVRQGRLLYLGVLPEWRGQGIGRQLLQQAMVDGREQGWEVLTIGPLPTTARGSNFLKRAGAEPRQTYLLYQHDL